MLNHITIMGRLTRDPELRRTGNGVAVASFRVAVDRDYSPKDEDDYHSSFRQRAYEAHVWGRMEVFHPLRGKAYVREDEAYHHLRFYVLEQ